MKILSEMEKEEFLHKHFKHRLTLLRTLRFRNTEQYNYQKQGDIYRCVLDSNLIGVRLFLDFMGLKGKLENECFVLKENNQKKHNDDIRINQFINRFILPSEIPAIHHRILAGVYVRGDKELAHITSTFSEEFNKEEVLIEAASIIEKLLDQFLYTPLGKTLPKMDI